MPRHLSNRERQVMRGIACGKSSKEIATLLGIAPSTVDWHVANALVKLRASNRAEGVVTALQHGELGDGPWAIGGPRWSIAALFRIAVAAIVLVIAIPVVIASDDLHVPLLDAPSTGRPASTAAPTIGTSPAAPLVTAAPGAPATITTPPASVAPLSSLTPPPSAAPRTPQATAPPIVTIPAISTVVPPISTSIPTVAPTSVPLPSLAPVPTIPPSPIPTIAPSLLPTIPPSLLPSIAPPSLP